MKSSDDEQAQIPLKKMERRRRKGKLNCGCPDFAFEEKTQQPTYGPQQPTHETLEYWKCNCT